MRDSVKIAAHAKINLTLEVLGVRPDGYHDLRSVVVPVPLHDDVTLESADGISVVMSGDLPQERNLAWKAAQTLRRVTGCALGVRIVIEKRIPAGAGLGGGSADAAAVLNGLNALWGLGLSKRRLCELAAEVGSDVPALTLGGSVLMEGRGERVTPLAESACADFPLPDLSRLVLRTPPVFVSTPAVFREFRESDRGLGVNDLQPAACRLHPEIAEALTALRAEGCTGVAMSGSGSSVFGFAKCRK
ncbi:MAG: 4-(cytidine 5'-diphospho)-2-C-methyl-D-erythritol kinase [Kiritimatiellia bacterium]